MGLPIVPEADLRAALDELGDLVGAIRFDLPGSSQTERNNLCRSISWSIAEYLLPRLGDLAAPLVVVLVGSTGSGKSTILNSLAESRVSEPGAIRPTTTVPVIWSHTDHADRYSADEFLSGYGSGGTSVVPGGDPVLRDLTLIDAPDFDSVVERNREIASDLLAVADVVVFVTSAQRYADAVPWEFLQKAKARGTPVVFVANRIPAEPGELVADYAAMLSEAGFEPAGLLYEIAEQTTDRATGALPPPAIQGLRSVLEALAARRREVVVTSAMGAIDEVGANVELLVTAIEAERAEVASLDKVVGVAYLTQVGEVMEALSSGKLIRNEVLARWQDFVGTGEVVKAVGDGLVRVADWARRVFGGTRQQADVPRDARLEVRDVLVRRADLAAASAAGAWELDLAGARLLEGGGLWRHGADTETAAEAAVDDWLVGITQQISDAGASKKRTATAASYGVNTLAVVVILGVFLQTGGLTGAEVGVAAGAAAAQQKLLEHLFGAAAARSLVENARKRLEELTSDVLELDADRFRAVLADRSGHLAEPDDLRTVHNRVRQLAEVWRGP